MFVHFSRSFFVVSSSARNVSLQDRINWFACSGSPAHCYRRMDDDISVSLSLPLYAGSAITETRMHDISSLFHFQLHATLYAAISSPISSSFRERAATSWVLSCSFDSLQSTISNKHNFRQQYTGSRSSGSSSQFQFNMVSFLLRANAEEWHASLFCAEKCFVHFYIHSTRW